MSQPQLGINGFGRIGRLSFRVWWLFHKDSVDLVAINTSGSMELEDWIHLVKYDTCFGLFNEPIKVTRHQSKKDISDNDPVLGTIQIGDKKITVMAQRDPAKLPWEKLGVETVIESTGVFRTADTASAHLKAGAKSVILSAPGKGGVNMNVIGVNDLDMENGLISNASCTTNCVAPVAKIMHQAFGVEKAHLTTIHSYTADQNLLDNSHKKDLRRARAAAQNMVPTSTGAAKATTQIIPDLKDKFDGLSVRVPTPTGSLSDMVFLLKKDVTKEEVNEAFVKASKEANWQGILAVTDEPIVSSDIVGRSESSIIDLSLTSVVGGNLVKVISWYDNEWGYCHRLLEQVIAVSK